MVRRDFVLTTSPRAMGKYKDRSCSQVARLQEGGAAGRGRLGPKVRARAAAREAPAPARKLELALEIMAKEFVSMCRARRHRETHSRWQTLGDLALARGKCPSRRSTRARPRATSPNSSDARVECRRVGFCCFCTVVTAGWRPYSTRRSAGCIVLFHGRGRPCSSLGLSSRCAGSPLALRAAASEPTTCRPHGVLRSAMS